MLKNKKAFAILELLVVVVIISVIAVMAIPKFISTIEKSKESRELAEIDSVQKALNHFYIDNGYYPTLQGGKPTFGDPKNIKFSEDLDGYGLYPKYLSSLPHFSYWWVDYKGTVYHTQYGLGQLEGTVISGLSAKYTYKVNGIEFKGNSVDLSGGKVLSVYDSKGNRLPDITADFKGGIRDPNDPNKNNEDTNNGDEPTPEPAPEKTPIDLTCLKFPGDVTIPRQSYVLSTNYTIETRVKVNSSTGVQGIITKGALANRELYLEISNGTLYYFIYNSARTPEGVSSSKNIYDNKWHHIAITNEWTDKGDLITLYIDGEKFQKQTSIHQSRNTNPITLGDVASGDGRKLNGFMDEVRIWNTVRTQEQINDCKDYELEGTEEGLVSYYNMNEGIGTIVHDKTANQNHASVSGTTWIDRWYLPPSANVGKVYNLAEAGWNRFDDSSPGITYTNMTIGTTTDTNNFFNGTYHQDSIASNPIGTIASSEFKMTGTQFRLMIQCYPSRNAKIRVYVDDEYIGWFSAPQNQINGRACCFESPILSDGTHTIKLENVKDGTGSFILDAIDIKGGVVVNEAPPNLVLGVTSK